MAHRYIEEDPSFDTIKRFGFFINWQLEKYFSVSEKHPIHDVINVMQDVPDDAEYGIDEKNLDDNFISLEYSYQNVEGSMSSDNYRSENYVACVRETSRFQYKGIGDCIWFTFYAKHTIIENRGGKIVKTEKGGKWYDAFCNVETECLFAFQASDDKTPTFSNDKK